MHNTHSYELEQEYRRRNRTFEDWLKVVSPKYTWDVPHLAYMRQYLEPIVAGEQSQIMFLAPPRHGKSEQNTIHFSAYYLYKNPAMRVILGAHTQNLGNFFSSCSKKLYAQTMPMDLRKKAITEWHTSQGGILKAAGMQTGVTGRGANLLLFDDPIKDRKEAYSKLVRDNIWNNYSVDFFTRREPGASIILTMTPWHHDDLHGRILNSEDAKNWTVIRLPATAGENDLLGRSVGSALWPERFDEKELLRIKSVMGDDYNSLYQLSPTLATGNIFKRAWFITQNQNEFPIRFDFIGQYWDTAFKTGQHNDYSVGVTLARYKDKRYILNVFREKLELYDLKKAVEAQAVAYRPNFIGIEDKGSGQSLIQEMGRTSALPVMPEGMGVTGDKEERANSVTPMLHNGDVILPTGAYWIDDFLDEICLFPQAPHDDQADTLVMGLDHQREVGYNLAAIIGA